MSDFLLVAVVITIIFAGTVLMTGSVLYFMVALYKLIRGHQGPAERTRESSPSEVEG